MPREARPPIHACLHDLDGKGSLMKLALVTIVTTNLEQMRTFYQGGAGHLAAYLSWPLCRIYPRGRHLAGGASPSVQSMGSMLCEGQPMIVS